MPWIITGKVEGEECTVPRSYCALLVLYRSAFFVKSAASDGQVADEPDGADWCLAEQEHCA